MDIFSMKFSRVYGCLLNKVVRKGRTKEELDYIISWFTSRSIEEINKLINTDITYEEFLNCNLNDKRVLIKGRVCNKDINLNTGLMLEIRRLDKLVDDLAKGKSIEKILNL